MPTTPLLVAASISLATLNILLIRRLRSARATIGTLRAEARMQRLRAHADQALTVIAKATPHTTTTTWIASAGTLPVTPEPLESHSAYLDPRD